MKRSTFLFFPLVALSFIACSSSNGNDPSEPITPDDKPVALNVRAEISQPSVSRAADTHWDANDSIGITAYNNSEMANRYKNVRYQTTGDGSFTSKTPIYFLNDNPVEFKAYYPYNPRLALLGTLKNNTRAKNQTPEGKKTIDYMWADITDMSKQNYQVTFGFIHLMTQIAITLKQGDGVDLKDLTSYTVSGFALEGTFLPDEGKAYGMGPVEDLVLNITGKSENTISLSPIILYPQRQSTFNLSVTLGGQVYSLEGIRINGGELQPGIVYNYTFTIAKTESGQKLELTNTEINPWTPQEGGEGTLYPKL